MEAAQELVTGMRALREGGVELEEVAFLNLGMALIANGVLLELGWEGNDADVLNTMMYLRDELAKIAEGITTQMVASWDGKAEQEIGGTVT